MCVQAGVYFSLMDFSRCLFALAADMSADRPDSQVLSNVVKWCKEGLSKLFFSHLSKSVAAWPGVPLLFNPTHKVSNVLFWYFRWPTDTHSNERDAADIFHHSLCISGNSWTPLTDSRSAIFSEWKQPFFLFFSLLLLFAASRRAVITKYN